MNPEVTDIIAKAEKWQPEINRLREIVLDCNLTEQAKWRQPCYSLGDKNILIIGSFKEYVSLSFFKGVLLKDEQKLLVAPGENSQTVRLVKLTSLEQIIELESTLKAYIFEAIEVEKAGLKVEFEKSTNLDFPPELIQKWKENPKFKAAFDALTPGRQRGYNLFFTGSKKSETRAGRVEKYVQRILDGYGIHDCVCGHSKRMPRCDGAHKFL